MSYSYQTFSYGQVLTSAQVQSLMDSVRDHVHGSGGVSLSLAVQNALTCYFLPSTADGWRGIYRAGFDWWNRNQQWGGPWGGEMVDAATGTVYRTEFATGYIESNDFQATADASARTWRFAGFKIPETQTVAAIWLKVYKVGNPTGNLQVYILPDDGTGKPSGSTPITDGTATAVSGKLFPSDTNGQWFRFSFSTPPSCTGGTQYHVAWKSSASVDASNYFATMVKSTTKTYPFGNTGYADGTPTWTASTANQTNFLIELSASAQTLQASGTFDGKLAFGGSGASGTLSMSRGLCNHVPMLELLDPTENTGYLVGAALTKDATILDAGWGEDHDRIVIRSNVTTGYAQIDVYESDGTKTTVTATATDLSSGTHSVGWYVRAKNDGADRIDLYVDGTTYSSATNLSLDFDKCMGLKGTIWVGGGFAVAPTYSGSSIGINGFSGLPSTLGWTYNGTATEGNAFSVSGGKLYQNKNGYASTDTGYYTKAWSANNANGYNSVTKVRVVYNTNVAQYQGLSHVTDDGTYRTLETLHEFYWENRPGGSYLYPQLDLKSNDSVLHKVAKGSDFFAFFNRRLVVDGSGTYSLATSSNQIKIGDTEATAGENSDAIYSYWKYYTTAWLPPQFTSGSISELAIWQGNMKALWPLLYNSGSQVSGKALMGLPNNYLDKSEKLPGVTLLGVAFRPTTTSATPVVATDMESFSVGEIVDIDHRETTYNSSGAAISNFVSTSLDGARDTASTTGQPVDESASMNPSAGYWLPTAARRKWRSYLGLHKAEGRWRCDGGTATSNNRQMTVEAKV